MVVMVVMPVTPPMVMVVVMMVMPVPPPAMMMVMMVGELRFTAGPRFGVLRFVGHERGQGIRDRIEKLPIACRRCGLGRLRGAAACAPLTAVRAAAAPSRPASFLSIVPPWKVAPSTPVREGNNPRWRGWFRIWPMKAHECAVLARVWRASGSGARLAD